MKLGFKNIVGCSTYANHGKGYKKMPVLFAYAYGKTICRDCIKAAVIFAE